jgi:hypothetical protein
MAENCYENYPPSTVILSNLVSLSTYIIGAYIISGLGLIYTILYLLFCIFMEIRLLKNGCTNCYYYGKICGFGKGRLSAVFFKKGDPSKFSQKKLRWKDMVPDMLIFILPLIAGIIILWSSFSWIIILMILLLLALSTAGNALVRGSLTCGKCKQRELGCPAEDLFHK